MVFINEWLPNPRGNDAKGEFIELFNHGSQPISLSGWTIKTSGKKVFLLSGYSISGGDYLLLPRPLTKLALKNTDETVRLYDAYGQLIDKSSFHGTAQEGKSWSRVDYGTSTAEHFAWGDPTPRAPNRISLNTTIASNNYPLGVALNRMSANSFDVIIAPLMLGMVFAAIMIYCVRQDDELSELFFGSNEDIR